MTGRSRLIWGVALAALALRLTGIGFGLPHLYHPDEAEIVDRALAMPLAGPDPGWFRYPTLYLYVQAAVYGLVALVTGGAGSFARFVAEAHRDPSQIYLAGRATTALVGAATVGVTGLAAARRGGAAAGVAAALLLCVFPLHVEHSHFVTTDVPLALFSALLAWQGAGLAAAGAAARARDYALAGALVGLAASTKYPGALLAVLVAAVYVLCARPSPRELLGDMRLPAAAAAAAAAFVAGSPYVVLNGRAFARDLAAEAAHMRAGHLGFEGAGSGWMVHLGHAYDSVGPLFLAVLALAVAYAAARRDRYAWALLASVAALFGVAGASRVLFARYLMPVLPLWCVLGGLAAAFGLEELARRAPRAGPAVAAGLLAAALFVPCLGTYHTLRLFLAPDTRTLAWAWAGSLGGGGARVRVAAERYALPEDSAALPGADVVPLEYDLAAVRAAGARYVVVSDRMYRRYTQAPENYAVQARFYASLVAEARPVRVFSPFEDASEGLLVPDSGGVRAAPVPGGPEWLALARRRLAGPVVVVYELSGSAAGRVAGAQALTSTS